MAIEIKAPTFPESVADGTVATWHKKPGDAVKRDELIVADVEGEVGNGGHAGFAVGLGNVGQLDASHDGLVG